MSSHCLSLATATVPQSQQPPSYPPLTADDSSTSIFGTSASKTGSSSSSETMSLCRTPSMLYQIIVEEEAKRAVSCELIETNLIADAAEAVAAAKEECESSYRVNDEADEAKAEASREYYESYWDMPSDDADVTTATLDADANVFSAGQVERLLVEDALRRAKESVILNSKGNGNRNGSENSHGASYWDWSAAVPLSEPVLESERRERKIASIVLEEAIRQRLSVDYITDLEERASSRREVQAEAESKMEEMVCDRHCSESDRLQSIEYWTWEEEKKKDDIDTDTVIVAPHVRDASHPNHAYWDFPSDVYGPEEARERLIAKILAEERIRELLSCEAVAEGEVQFHRVRREREGSDKKKNSNSSSNKDEVISNSALASVPSNYWDFHSEEDGFLSLVAAVSEKQQIIDRILREEEQRFVLSTENIERNLRVAMKKMKMKTSASSHGPIVTVEGRQQPPAGSPITATTMTTSTSYWDW